MFNIEFVNAWRDEFNRFPCIWLEYNFYILRLNSRDFKAMYCAGEEL